MLNWDLDYSFLYVVLDEFRKDVLLSSMLHMGSIWCIQMHLFTNQI